MAAVEVQAKVSKYGWDLSDWPLEVSFLTDSAGHNLFFLLFILPAFFAVYLAVARHGEDPSE